MQDQRESARKGHLVEKSRLKNLSQIRAELRRRKEQIKKKSFRRTKQIIKKKSALICGLNRIKGQRESARKDHLVEKSRFKNRSQIRADLRRRKEQIVRKLA